MNKAEHLEDHNERMIEGLATKQFLQKRLIEVKKITNFHYGISI